MDLSFEMKNMITSPIYRTRLITHGTLWGLVAGAIAGKRRSRYPGSFPTLCPIFSCADHLFVRYAYPASLYTAKLQISYGESATAIHTAVGRTSCTIRCKVKMSLFPEHSLQQQYLTNNPLAYWHSPVNVNMRVHCLSPPSRPVSLITTSIK